MSDSEIREAYKGVITTYLGDQMNETMINMLSEAMVNKVKYGVVYEKDIEDLIEYVNGQIISQ